MFHVVVVTPDTDGLARALNVLNSAGYLATGASTFADGARAVAGTDPDLVIAEERLGAHHGLHVILRARARRPDVSAIVSTPQVTSGLEADARSLDVRCVTTPQSPADWLQCVSSILYDDRGSRHSMTESVQSVSGRS
jgi:DNA-binding response OmpR family regulator